MLCLFFMPILQILFPIIKSAGVALVWVAKVTAQAYNALAKAINWALGWLGVKLNTINIGDLNEAIQDLTDLTWDEAMARAKNIEELENATEALRNVPEGYKIALTRFQAAMGAVPAMATAGGPTTMATMASVTTVTSSPVNEVASTQQIIIQGDVYGWDDFKAKVDQANHELHRSAGMRRYGTAKGWGY